MQPKWTPAEFYVNLWVLMHCYTCKSLLNTLRSTPRTIGCVPCQASKSQQSRSKYNSHAKPVRSVKMSYEYLMRCQTGCIPFICHHDIVTPIAPPTGCGFHPAPYATLPYKYAQTGKSLKPANRLSSDFLLPCMHECTITAPNSMWWRHKLYVRIACADGDRNKPISELWPRVHNWKFHSNCPKRDGYNIIMCTHKERNMYTWNTTKTMYRHVTHYFLYCPILFCAVFDILCEIFSKAQKVK